VFLLVCVLTESVKARTACIPDQHAGTTKTDNTELSTCRSTLE